MIFALAVILLGVPGSTLDRPNIVRFDGLLAEMTDPGRLVRFPTPAFECKQASSYNRDSKKRSGEGWFADGDGTGYVRTESIAGRTEYVLMEHVGPGCLTKFWTPFFYYDFGNRVGPNIRIRIDGRADPVIDEPFIAWVTGKGSLGAPFAAYSARAGNNYLPIPYSKSVKVTTTERPFYYLINFRSYSKETKVESFESSTMQRYRKVLERCKTALTASRSTNVDRAISIPAQGKVVISELRGPGAIRELAFRIPGAKLDSSVLRSTILSIRFDGGEQVWCPIGDFFCSADAINPFRTIAREVRGDGTLICRWVMPFKESAEVRIVNLSSRPIEVGWGMKHSNWTWTPDNMHFYARWRPDDIVPGTPFQDWNFVDIKGRGVYVGDAWTVLNVRKDSWWGEGDEKIYVDGDWERGFPSHFGTGTEDYYGWAGGVYPDLKDEFSAPFLANVKVGGLDGHTQGFNICTRSRGLDAIPFQSRLRFDMEASFGTDMREPWDLLGYSAVTFWYAIPGAIHNRAPSDERARLPLMSIKQIEAIAAGIKRIRK